MGQGLWRRFRRTVIGIGRLAWLAGGGSLDLTGGESLIGLGTAQGRLKDQGIDVLHFENDLAEGAGTRLFDIERTDIFLQCPGTARFIVTIGIGIVQHEGPILAEPDLGVVFVAIVIDGIIVSPAAQIKSRLHCFFFFLFAGAGAQTEQERKQQDKQNRSLFHFFLLPESCFNDMNSLIYIFIIIWFSIKK